MSAGRRAAEALRAARRELVAMQSEVGAHDVASTRFLAAELQALRQRLDGILRAVESMRPDPQPPAA